MDNMSADTLHKHDVGNGEAKLDRGESGESSIPQAVNITTTTVDRKLERKVLWKLDTR